MNAPAPRPPRWFLADDILAGRVLLDGYPFQFIYISARTPTGISLAFGGQNMVVTMADQVLSAAEFLEAHGWDVVNFEQGGQIAYMRRRSR